ncbi:DUF1294 domain-containing protein [Ornithinibacillus halophilus]|uniref:Uncharacterized membrane protein YsdA, DUF1294 family n=1 Tax=Ornithinibacillus halophilus TaxID=930117 RepID=A0A1M5J1A5_9BACI|nr:DUF1294 domain-containing protein [Ornithinibacillus halophilus]SHG34079.1 Uncharacterized membrane protein YsdA, DUF1294 family [Ornithinibacillus halophilus]
MDQLDVLLPYLLTANLIGFLFMGLDKRKAKNQQWRIPERTLWGIAILGGAVGSLLGMKVFRHKTKHRAFTVGMPLLIVLHIIALAYLLGVI